MGTDIHCFVEARRAGRWVHVGEENPGGTPEDPSWKGVVPGEVLDTRNYSAFAILAGVRGGVRTRKPPVPIASPRGLPVDVSGVVGRWFEWWDSAAHDASWLTLAELQGADWDAVIEGRGVVPAAVAATLNQPLTRSPVFQVDGGGYRGPSDSGPGEEVTWTESYRDAFGKAELDQLFSLLAFFGKPDEVRIVFWFDS